MAITRKKPKIPAQPSFDNGYMAGEIAKRLSFEGHDTRYVIQCGDMFFVSDTKQVQPYEKLVESYRYGRLHVEY